MWPCSGCGTPNQPMAAYCRSCRMPKSGRREGDWDCPSCTAVNFSMKVVCFRCGAKPAHRTASPASIPDAVTLDVPSKPGELTPEHVSEVLNALDLSEDVMPAPDASSPPQAPGDTSPAHGHSVSDDSWQCVRCGSIMPRSTWVRCSDCTLPRLGRRPGDWDCSNCGAVNFPDKSWCFRCKRTPAPSTLLAQQQAQ